MTHFITRMFANDDKLISWRFRKRRLVAFVLILAAFELGHSYFTLKSMAIIQSANEMTKNKITTKLSAPLRGFLILYVVGFVLSLLPMFALEYCRRFILNRPAARLSLNGDHLYRKYAINIFNFYYKRAVPCFYVLFLSAQLYLLFFATEANARVEFATFKRRYLKAFNKTVHVVHRLYTSIDTSDDFLTIEKECSKIRAFAELFACCGVNKRSDMVGETIDCCQKVPNNEHDVEWTDMPTCSQRFDNFKSFYIYYLWFIWALRLLVAYYCVCLYSSAYDCYHFLRHICIDSSRIFIFKNRSKFHFSFRFYLVMMHLMFLLYHN
jgi:hypothetical protein